MYLSCHRETKNCKVLKNMALVISICILFSFALIILHSFSINKLWEKQKRPLVQPKEVSLSLLTYSVLLGIEFSAAIICCCCCWVAKLCPTLCNLVNGNKPGFPVLHYLLEVAQTHVHWVSDANQSSHPLLPASPLSLSLLQHQGLFQWVSSSQQVAKVLELQHQSFQEYSGLISFRIDWFDPLAAQGTLKRLLQYHSSKASILWCSAFFMVQLSHPYMATGKIIVLTIQTSVSKVIFLLFHMLSFSSK